jgi:hypothetical protein
LIAVCLFFLFALGLEILVHSGYICSIFDYCLEDEKRELLL